MKSIKLISESHRYIPVFPGISLDSIPGLYSNYHLVVNMVGEIWNVMLVFRRDVIWDVTTRPLLYDKEEL